MMGIREEAGWSEEQVEAAMERQGLWWRRWGYQRWGALGRRIEFRNGGHILRVQSRWRGWRARRRANALREARRRRGAQGSWDIA